MKSRVLATTSIAALAISAAASGWGAAALAQDGEGAQDRIVVTGSRIARRDFQANSPIVTIEADTFENRSTFSVESALNQLPQFTPDGSGNLGSSAGSPFLDASQAPGAATLNLRGLGSNRSLVLMNGRRPQPVNSFLVVDVNTIPSAAIENVEVITGGAAAVYGADAIAGVVNFIIKDDFEGFELDAQYGQAEAGDAQNAQISALVGGNFDSGRGNAMVGIVWSERGSAFQRDREFYTRGWMDPGTTAGSVNNAVPGLTQANIGFSTFGVNANGSTFSVSNALNPAAPYTGPLNNLAGGAGYKINPKTNATATAQGLGFNDPDAQLSIPLTRYSAFASGHYDLTDNVTAFLEANYTHTFTSAVSLVPPAFNFWSLTVPYTAANDDPDSPTFGANQANFHPVSRQLADLLNARPGGTTSPWVMTRSLDFLGRLRTDTTSNIFQMTAGLEGEFGIKDWTWEVYGSHGQTDVIAQQPRGDISQQFIQQIINGRAMQLTNGVLVEGPLSATGAWGRGWSNGPGGTNQTATVGNCTTGIPIFNPDGSVPQQVSVSQDCIDYATLETNSITTLEQNIFEATMQGGLLDLPAGELRFALGATYRDVGFAFVPDSGLSANQMRANVINIISLPRSSQGDLSVTEAYGEVLVPVLADLPLIQSLSLELGGRYSDYDTTGGEETYKALGDWTVTDWLRFRGGYQLATRSPNVYELFTPLATSPNFSPTNDPCTNIPGFTAPYGNLTTNPNRVNLQLACAELIRRDGGFNYTTLATAPGNTGQDPNLVNTNPGAIDLTHISNFRWTVPGYNFAFPITLALVRGNEGLESEEATTWTLGGVLNSPVEHPLLDGLSLSVDWYQIELTNTIDTLTATQVYQQCLDPQFNPLIAATPGSQTGAQILAGNPFCDLINREPVDFSGTAGAVGSGLDRNYEAQFRNLGGTNTSGIDVQVNWIADFEDMGLAFIPGSLGVNFVANLLDKYEESPFEGASFVDYTGTLQGPGYFDYRTFTTLTWNTDAWSLGARARYTPEIDPAPALASTQFPVSAHTEVDLFGRFTLNETIEFRGGIDNVLDEQPEVVGRTQFNRALNSTNSDYYDTLGRRFFVGATLRY